jgi:hypothetical protein
MSTFTNTITISMMLSMMLSVAYANQCTTFNQVGHQFGPNPDVDSIQGIDAGQCCDACHANSNCKGWTWTDLNYGPVENCFMYSEPSDGVTYHDDCVSGNPVSQCRWVGDVYNIPGGFSCYSQTDAEIDAVLHGACEAAYPGSHAASGVELQDYQNIVDLPATPVWPGAPTCPGCDGCDNGGGRFCMIQPFWDPSYWTPNHVGAVLSATCLVCGPPVPPPSCALRYRLLFAHSETHQAYSALRLNGDPDDACNPIHGSHQHHGYGQLKESHAVRLYENGDCTGATEDLYCAEWLDYASMPSPAFGTCSNDGTTLSLTGLPDEVSHVMSGGNWLSVPVVNNAVDVVCPGGSWEVDACSGPDCDWNTEFMYNIMDTSGSNCYC